MNVSVSTIPSPSSRSSPAAIRRSTAAASARQIAVVTKSGTEQFHGSGYWYHRNDSLNANTFLNNVRGLLEAAVPL